jgi:hypothetical protein
MPGIGAPSVHAVRGWCAAKSQADPAGASRISRFSRLPEVTSFRNPSRHWRTMRIIMRMVESRKDEISDLTQHADIADGRLVARIDNARQPEGR